MDKDSSCCEGGLNKMEWILQEDNSMSEVFRCAWIDMIDFTQSSSLRIFREIFRLPE